MKRPADLPESLSQRLNSYALAASAAGVSLLALAHPAEGKIIYTPAHKAILNGNPYPLDLNKDGVPDFLISYRTTGHYGTLAVCPDNGGKACRYYHGPQANAIWGYAASGWRVGFASALPAGDKVGPNYMHFHRHKHTGNFIMVFFSCASASVELPIPGQWDGDVQGRYLGFRFSISGKAHYGWARLNVQTQREGPFLDVTLTGYAYETIPNKPIIAGKTKGPDAITLRDASLAHLARGASAIPAWRSGPK